MHTFHLHAECRSAPSLNGLAITTASLGALEKFAWLIADHGLVGTP
jgi:hypothetical protein